MNVRIAASLLGLSLSLLAAPATAQVQANLRPDRVGAPYRFVLELVSDGSPVDVVFDRRLLTLRVHAEGRRRPLTCRHPAAPSRVLSSRVVHLDSSSSRVAEWLDLRMYCTGRALAALRAGAPVDARYGFRRRGSHRWVVKPEQGPPIHRLDLAQFTLAPLAAELPVDGPIRLSLRPSTLHVGSPPSLRVTLRSAGAAQVVYPRDDLYSFHIR
ncbi:MAG: hypothetical protein GXP55_01535, partial [Deltaproteobacteria bacterium]|nr:hypothetical protein [Deltaproteobacteria bacterium]